MSRRRRPRGDLRGQCDRVDAVADGDGDGCVAVQLDQTRCRVCTLRFEVVRVVARELIHSPVAAETDSHAMGRAVAAILPVLSLGTNWVTSIRRSFVAVTGVPLGRRVLHIYYSINVI